MYRVYAQRRGDWKHLMDEKGRLFFLFSAVLAIAQTNLRKMLAFASMSHVGLVLLGIASFSIQGVQGIAVRLKK